MNTLSQIACPACSVGNRVPEGRDFAKAKCGQCGRPLFPGAPIDVDDEGLATHLRLTRGAVLLDVWAQWCGPCRTMAPQFAEAARRISGEAVFLKMNADQSETPAKLGVRGIPALLLFKDGKLVAQTAGAMPAQAILEWVAQSLTLRSVA